jgi:anti-anti-sigma factor
MRMFDDFGATNLEMRVAPAPDRVVLHPIGPINSVNAASFRAKLMSAVERFDTPIELDLADVPYATAAAFNAILAAIDRHGLRAQKLRLTHCSAIVYKAMDIVNLTSLADASG